MRRALFLTLAAVLVSAYVLSPAAAYVSFGDPAGDAADAPDVTRVYVSNDVAGNILFHVLVDNLTPESRVQIWIDADRNPSTGEDGADYGLLHDRSANLANVGWAMGKWNGSRWIDPQQRSMSVVDGTTYVDFRVNQRDLGGTNAFAFQVWTNRWTGDVVTARDRAPDGELRWWNYDLSSGLSTPTPAPAPVRAPVVKPLFGKLRTTQPVAGKRVTWSLQVLRSDNGKPLATGTMVSELSIAGKVIEHAEQFRQGVATLTFVLPKSSKGKVLKVRITIAAGAQSATKVTTIRVS